MSDYLILERKPSVRGGEIILAALPDNPVTPWVTWFYYVDQTTQRPVREGGHYFYKSQGLKAAIEDFETRM